MLENQKAIVTGAAQGIGLAIAERFLAEGATVAMLDIDEVRLRQTSASSHKCALPLQLDVTAEHAVKETIQTISKRFERIDILVNNAAARTPKCPITELSYQQWEEALRVNLSSAFLMCRAVLPAMQAQASGVIINVASQLGSVATHLSVPYCASKGGMLQFTKALALDHATQGIRVNSLSPGAVMTERITCAFPDADAAQQTLGAKHPIGRIGEPSEIAAAAVFLASNQSSFMTGADMIVDGGYTAQ